MRFLHETGKVTEKVGPKERKHRKKAGRRRKISRIQKKPAFTPYQALSRGVDKLVEIATRGEGGE